MSRDLSTAISNSLDDDVVYPFFAVELLFDGDDVLRMWTGYGTLVYNSVEWYGTGNLLDISSVEETTEIAAKGANLVLSSVPSEVLSLALQVPYQERLCKIYFGMFGRGNLLSEDGAYILLEDGSRIEVELQETGLTEIFTGYMDRMDIEEAAESSVIQLKAENKLIDLEAARIARFTNSYQQEIYSGDRGLEFVEDLQDKQVYWGKVAPQ
jgi:hypothetical protein